MKRDDVNYIDDLLQKKESATFEFKAYYSKEEAAKVICSFLNRDGGQLVIGKEEGQKVVGIQDAEKLALELQKYLSSEIIPGPAVSVDIQKVNNKNILIISVWQGSNQPYIYQGAVYFRVGNTTIQANSKQLAALIHNESERNQRWEEKSSIEVDLDDIDLNEVKECIKETKFGGREQNVPENPLQFLEKYNLYRNGDLTNAAVILFGKNPIKYFPQVRVRLSVFKYDKTSEIILYDKLFDGNLFNSLRQIIDFFDLAYGVSSSFQKNEWKRIDNQSFPRLAIREAILNAFIHRDYSSFSSRIAINIYPDRLQISSYGSFPKGISIRTLSEDHISIPVNPSIAHIFFLRNWIELIGIGTVKMIAQCKELGFKTPIWTQKDNTVSVVFPDVKVPFNYNEGISEGISEGIDNLIAVAQNEGLHEGISKGITTAVKESFVEIVTLIAKEKNIKASEIANKLNRPYKTIERYISKLKEIGAVEYKGSKRAGGYILSSKIKDLLK
jgi:ATP-dependent DNA helicase RecG